MRLDSFINISMVHVIVVAVAAAAAVVCASLFFFSFVHMYSNMQFNGRGLAVCVWAMQFTHRHMTIRCETAQQKSIKSEWMNEWMDIWSRSHAIRKLHWFHIPLPKNATNLYSAQEKEIATERVSQIKL